LRSAAKLAENDFDAISARACDKCAPAEDKGNSAGHGAVGGGAGLLLIGGSQLSARSRGKRRESEGGREGDGRGRGWGSSRDTLPARAKCRIIPGLPLPPYQNRVW
jgi:hypothetical protein